MTISSNYFYYRYPQYLWAKEIKNILKSDIIPDIHSKNIIDAPCGDGVISFWVKKSLKNPFYLYDIEKSRIQIAQKNIKGATIVEKNIFNLNLDSKNNVWLFINSLYCLPDKEMLLENMADQMEYILAIFPYTNHLNYKTFFLQNPGFINPSEMDKDQTILFFKEFHYNLILTKDITHISFYKKYFPFFNSIINKLYILSKRFSKNKPGAYWIGVFKKVN
jgi:hypothetical protein